jgi:hypothetical protein
MDRIWLYHPETKAVFHCPADAAKAWQARGWAECEEPAEANLAVAEYTPLPVAEPPKQRRGRQPQPSSDPAGQPGETSTESSEGVSSVG